MAWSQYQSNIFNAVLSTSDNILVNAVAGSGKSTTLREIVRIVGNSVHLYTFGVKAAADLNAKLPPDLQVASTYNSAGYTILRQHQKMTFDVNKTDKIIANLLPQNKYYHYPVRKLVGLVKSHLLEPTDYNLRLLVIGFDVDTYQQDNLIFDAVRKTINIGKQKSTVCDYDDQIWLPVVLNMQSKSPDDFILVDEAQDTNIAQCKMISDCLSGPNTRVVVVGDPFQSIYRFRGADSNAMDNLQRAFDATPMPLSICYRCPLEVVDLVNRDFPHIKFEAAPGAIQGKVSKEKESRFLDAVKPKDMVLCRTNAPLVSYAFALIRKGVKAQIAGREIGPGLKSLIRKMKCDDKSVSEMLSKLRQFVDVEMEKLITLERYQQAQTMQDKFDTVLAISENSQTVTDLYNNIDNLFADTTDGVLLSTVHKQKGGEAHRVFILEPQLMPHPMAKKPEDKQQEANIEYVAKTRSMNELYFVEKG